MNQMMNPNVDITLVIRKSADGRMAEQHRAVDTERHTRRT